MIGKIIHLRSPIFCKNIKLCRTCYGDLLKQIRTKNVGIVAASEVGSLSEKIMKAFHLGGAVLLKQLDIIKEIMNTTDDILESKIRQSLEQIADNLVNKSSLVILKIDKHIYKLPNKINELDDSYILPVGHFDLILHDSEIKIRIEQEIKIYKSKEMEEDEKYISIMYGKNEKIFYAKPSKEDFTNLAQKLDSLVGGKSPWSDVPGLYNKFYTALKIIGDWDSVHLEVVISNSLRSKKNPQKPARLVEPFDPQMFSIKTLPSIISWPLGLAFENFSKSLQYGLISDRGPSSPIEKVMFGESLLEEK